MSGASAPLTGKRVEQLAERWLVRHGLTAVARNYRCRVGEIDLIMRAGTILAIVEVKYRSHGARVSAMEALTPAKQRRIALTTQHFLQRHHALAALQVRFDLLAVTGAASHAQFRWLRDAFRPAL